MATLHHPPEGLPSHRNLWAALIVLALIVAAAIVYTVASAVSRDAPPDRVVLPAEQPVTGGLTADGGIVDEQPTAETPPAPADAPLPGKTVTDPNIAPTENGVVNGARPTDG